MRLIYDERNKTFLWCGDYDTRHLPKGAGFRWDPLGKVWFTNQYDRAQKLREHATPECRKALDAQAQAAADALALSRAADAPVEIPRPDGCEYLGYQKAGIVYASQRANCLIGDEPGLGKTIQAIGVANMDASVKSVLVICPASLKLNWLKEILKWDVKRGRVVVLEGTKGLSGTERNGLKCLGFLDSEIRKKGGQAGDNVASFVKVPSVLNLMSESMRLPYVSKSSVGRNPIHKGLVGIVNAYTPSRVPLTGRSDAPFSVKNTSHISNVCVKRRGDERTVGALLVNSISKPNAEPSKIADCDSEIRTNSRIGFTGFESGDCGSNLGDGELGSPMFISSIDDADWLQRKVELLKSVFEGDMMASVFSGCLSECDLPVLYALRNYLRAYFIESEVLHADLQWLVMNYNILHGWRPSIDDFGQFDLLILDEVHFCKNAKAQRTAEVLGKGRPDRPDEYKPPIQAKRRLFLTGTPIVNRPAELWTLVHSLDPQTWRSWKAFVERYCGAYQTKWGWETGGATNLPELQQKLRQTIMVRRLKADVLTELPPKRRKVIVLSADEYTGVIEREKQLTDRIDASLASVRAEVELAKAEDDAEYETAVARLQKAEMVAFTEMAQVRHDTAVAKVPAVIEQCKELLEETDRIVVFAHHHDVVDALMAGLAEFQPVKLTGTCSMAEKQQAVDTFQAQGECRVFVGSITAAGLGITLTAASTVVFAELDYVPGNVSQAEDRLHRIGQRDHVLVYHIVLDGSMDQKLAETLVEKQAVIDSALDKVGGTVKEEPIELPNQAATKSARKGQIEELAQKLTPADMLVIHSCLRQLAGMDQDHAHTQNDMGFNKVDTHIGHDLAERAYLTPKQSALGFLLCRKYKRQAEEIEEVLV